MGGIYLIFNLSTFNTVLYNMITFLKFTNQSGATVKYTPISLKFSGDDFFVLSNTFIKGRTENESERAFDAMLHASGDTQMHQTASTVPTRIPTRQKVRT